ncbi:ribosomal large subunit pseudouridine synthase D [Edaphobacillus lindanitolerans]|uniref:Pseudouridine synthase n=2 Tax=Edaphobacillus lindanitolerans TaxID=550447 RepID=A0A1U7PLT5_9BACI|nr:RluA family pseudouridine synthase [Edaphobacillus lindanitolerans]SIT67730.1 ribosomal large subunit pseudouridine synthase D [Edaphobacillus lindanitolerans]
MENYSFKVTAEQDRMRLDKLLPAIREDWTRSKIQVWIKDGLVKVNGREVKPNHALKENDEITIGVPEPEPLEIVPEDLGLEIVWEDGDVLVVNKPRGMVVHPAAGHATGTLVNGLMHHCTDLSGINGVLRPGIVHRIDKDTTGLLGVAKNDRAHVSLAAQLAEKSVTRKYTALVHGNIDHDKGTIDAPIGRDPKDRQKMTVIDGGKSAVTHFTVTERFGDFTLIECRLETGRTHQIRVHMKYIGHPLAGDPKYGPRNTIEFGGQVLHAGVLGFVHPATGEYMEFEAPLPADFTELLEKLRSDR